MPLCTAVERVKEEGKEDEDEEEDEDEDEDGGRCSLNDNNLKGVRGIEEGC